MTSWRTHPGLFKCLLLLSGLLVLLQWHQSGLADPTHLPPITALPALRGGQAPADAHSPPYAPCATVLTLHRPWRHFDSDSWFHVSEYYAPHHLEAHRLGFQARARCGPSSTLLSGPDTVFVLANDPEFVRGLTGMTTMLLRLFLVYDYRATVVYVEPRRTWEAGNKTCFALGGMLYIDQLGSAGVHGTDAVMDYCCHGNAADARIASICPHLSCSDKAASARSTWTPPLRGARICAHHIGQFGDVPVARGEWFSGADEVNSLRKRVRNILSDIWAARDKTHYEDVVDTTSAVKLRLDSVASSIPPGLFKLGSGSECSLFPVDSSTTRSVVGLTTTVLVFLRDRDRKLSNLSRMLLELRSNLDQRHAETKRTCIIEVLKYHDSLPPEVVIRSFQRADILLTVHGFQCMGLIFMHPSSLVIEVFPYNYYKIDYKYFAEEVGVKHKWLQNGEPNLLSLQYMRLIPEQWCMSSVYCRRFARRDNVYISGQDVDAISRWVVNFDSASDRRISPWDVRSRPIS